MLFITSKHIEQLHISDPREPDGTTVRLLLRIPTVCVQLLDVFTFTWMALSCLLQEIQAAEAILVSVAVADIYLEV